MEKTVFLCLSSSPRKSWNVTSLEKCQRNKTVLWRFCSDFIFHYTFYGRNNYWTNTPVPKHCFTLSVHKLNVNKYNKHEKIVFFIISVSSKSFFFPTSQLCYLCSEDYLDIRVEGSNQSVSLQWSVLSAHMLVPEIKKAQKNIYMRWWTRTHLWKCEQGLCTCYFKRLNSSCVTDNCRLTTIEICRWVFMSAGEFTKNGLLPLETPRIVHHLPVICFISMSDSQSKNAEKQEKKNLLKLHSVPSRWCWLCPCLRWAAWGKWKNS